MQVKRVSTIGELRQLTDDWNCLTRGVPLRSWQWLFSWWKHFESARELYVLTVTDASGNLIGAAPFFRDRDRAAGRVLRLLGSGEVCTDHLTILSTHEHEVAVAEAIAQWLVDAAADPQQRWDLLELEHVAAANKTLARLVDVLAEHGASVHTRPGMGCWKLPLAESWDAFLASTSKNRRRNLRRYARGLESLSDARFQIARNEADLARGWQILVDLHQRRRESLGQAGCFHSDSFAGFLREAASELLATNQLQLCWLESAGRPIAIECDLIGGDAVYAYQSGIDPAALEQSPGHLLTVAILRRAIDDGLRTYDLLRGDEHYKANWGASEDPAVSYRVAAGHWQPRLRHGLWTAGFAMKNWVKGGLTLTSDD